MYMYILYNYNVYNVHIHTALLYIMYKSKNVQFNAFKLKIEYRDLFSYTVLDIQMVSSVYALVNNQTT